MGTDLKRTMHSRQKSVNILLQAEEGVKPLEPCIKLGLAALYQRLGKARAGGASIRRPQQKSRRQSGEAVVPGVLRGEARSHAWNVSMALHPSCLWEATEYHRLKSQKVLGSLQLCNLRQVIRPV